MACLLSGWHGSSTSSERELAGWHLFGEAGRQNAVKRAATLSAPETRLRLTLKGVFASDEAAAAGWAIIADPKGKEDTYEIGDPLPGNAKLSEIYVDRIILERGGRFETLKLPKNAMLWVVEVGAMTFIGFRLQPGKKRGALKELGLKPGDIVTSINGIKIDAPAKGMKAMQALGKGDSVGVTLLRGGQEISLNLTLPASAR